MMEPNLHLKLGRSVGLMLRMFKPIFSTVKSVAMYSAYYVANGIFALLVKGVHAVTLTKKRQYWLKSFPGDLANQHC